MKAVEIYYTVQECAICVRLSDRTVKDKAKAGEFGKDVVDLGTSLRPDYRIPGSGINAYLDARRLFSESTDPAGIAARTEGELRRKAGA